MLRTLIVEDELYIRKGLLAMIKRLDKGIEVLGECESVKDAVVVAKATKPDLVLLDINLTDGNAFDFLKQTSSSNFKVIFITAYEQHALQAIKNGAIDYILKPIDFDELTVALDKVININTAIHKKQLQIVENHLINKIKTKIVLHLQEGFQIIEFDSLMFCKSDKGYTSFYMSDGKSYIASKPLIEFESQLPSQLFFRTHQSYIVNMDYVNRYDKNGYIFLKSGEKIPVASRRKDNFIEKLHN